MLAPKNDAFRVGSHFEFSIYNDFWNDNFIEIVRKYEERAYCIPLDPKWAVVGDLFNPPPDQWGLRGDLFLWLEMQQALSHGPIPDDPTKLSRILAAAFLVLTGESLASEGDVFIKRFDRGGMSSGTVAKRFWTERALPLLQQRAIWIQQSCAGIRPTPA